MKFHCLAINENFPKVIQPEGCNVKINVHHSSAQCAGFQFRCNDGGMISSQAKPKNLKTQPAYVMPIQPRSLQPSLLETKLVPKVQQNERVSNKKRTTMKILATVMNVF